MPRFWFRFARVYSSYASCNYETTFKFITTKHKNKLTLHYHFERATNIQKYAVKHINAECLTTVRKVSNKEAASKNEIPRTRQTFHSEVENITANNYVTGECHRWQTKKRASER